MTGWINTIGATGANGESEKPNAEITEAREREAKLEAVIEQARERVRENIRDHRMDKSVGQFWECVDELVWLEKAAATGDAEELGEAVTAILGLREELA